MPKQHQAVDMTQGDPLGLLVRFSLPLLAGNAFQQLYNMVDSWVVGNFVGTTALAAVGIGFPVIYLLSSLFMGLSIGGSVVIAQFMGAGDREAVRRSVNTVYGAVMVSVVPLTLFGVLIAGPILHLIRVPADVYDQAHVYLQVIFAGIIGSLGYNINAGILQGLGDSKTPLLFLATACVVNIVLDLVFVLVFDWGVFGVAFATIIAQLCSWIFGVCYVNRKYDFIAIRPLHISVDNVLLKRVLKLCVPSGIQQCQFSVAILVLQALINGFGAEFAAGFSAANKVDTFAFMPVDSFCLAVTTYVGQNVGAGRLDRVREGVRKAILLCVGVCLVMSVLVVLNAERLIMLFNTDPLVVASGRAYLLRVVSPMFLMAIMYPINNALRGAGAAIVPMLSSVVALWAARVPAAYLLAHFFGPEELYWSYSIGWVLGVIISGTVYLRGRWKERCVVHVRDMEAIL